MLGRPDSLLRCLHPEQSPQVENTELVFAHDSGSGLGCRLALRMKSSAGFCDVTTVPCRDVAWDDLRCRSFGPQ